MSSSVNVMNLMCIKVALLRAKPHLIINIMLGEQSRINCLQNSSLKRHYHNLDFSSGSGCGGVNMRKY